MHLMKVAIALLSVVIFFASAGTQERVKLDTNLSILAMKFIEKWLPGQKLFVRVILPDNSQFYTGDIVKATKMISNEFASGPYLLFDFIENKDVTTDRLEVYLLPFQIYRILQ